MKISVFSLFRDSEKYIDRFFKQLSLIEENTDASFEYFFYENDSVDKTPSILKKWIKGKKGKVLCENFENQSFQSDFNPERMIHLSKCRNKMQSLDTKQDSNYTIVVDSDVIFDKSVVNKFLKYKDLDFSMLTSNIRQNIPCKMGSGKSDSYYDSSILFDLNKFNGMTWSYNPFYEDKDRKLFDSGKPVQVLSAFGSLAFLKTETFHKVHWQSKGESEHMSFCHQLNKLGKIYLIPEIKPKVKINETNFPQMDSVIKNQKWLLSSKWNRFLLKTGSNNLQ